MEINLITVVELINGVGFPIAICVYLLWYSKTTVEKQQTLLSELKNIIRDNSEVMKDLIDEIKRK